MTEASVPLPERFHSDADWPSWPSASVIDRASIHVLRIWLPDRRSGSADDWRLLSADEQARATRFLIDSVRQRFVACRAVLRHAMAQLLNGSPAAVTFEYGEHGKPRLACGQGEDNLSFNVSHSADVALLAFGWNCELGADVEAVDERGWRTLARRFFAPAEWQQMEQLPPELQRAAFYRVWSCKEAYMKATGRGMSLPLGCFAVCADPRRPPRLMNVVNDLAEAARWRVETVDPAPGFAAAAMWNGPATLVCRWTWPGVASSAPVTSE